jgi:hypothetical protein
MVARKQKEKGLGTMYIFPEHTPSDPLPPSRSYFLGFHHLPVMPSYYEFNKN